ncbi:hypothetical protein ACHAXR_007017 [Thalassiosira sp. AJA248-18]
MMWQDQSCQLAWVGGESNEAAASAAQMDIDGNAGDITSGSVDGKDEINAVSNKLSETKLSPGMNGAIPPPPPPISENEHLQDHPHTQTMARNFAMEHRIFLRAILDLLSERDQLSIEADVNGPNTLKIGSLRKASHRIKGLWKTKYVEIRQGTFSYYDNAKQRINRNGGTADGRTLLRKDIQLKASMCTCRAVKIRSVKILPSNSEGAVFELRIQGGSRRLWMANTREERQDWMKAIHNAMIGASVTRGDNFVEYQIEQVDGHNQKNKNQEQYLEVRASTNRAESKDEYLPALSCLRGETISVPVQWIRSQLDDSPAATAFVETDISSSVEQLWKDLLRDSVEINGEVLVGESFHGPERIVGKLTQQILSLDAAILGVGSNQSSDWERTRISEAQAISYSRDILLACDRTRSGGDSYFCAENLCLNRNLVVLCPSSTEASPLSIKVSGCKGIKDPDMTDISGWVFARSSSGKPWKRQYLVLSHSVLSCYAEADPKPHRLLEQVMLQGAKIGNSQSMQKEKQANLINITTKDGQVVREYLFEDEFDFLFWQDSLKKSACDLNEDECQENKHSKDTNGLNNLCSTKCSTITPTVDVVVNVCTEYKMCTIDPSGIESEDTWAALRTTFVQNFSLTGGRNGRISRGDEVVQIEIL